MVAILMTVRLEAQNLITNGSFDSNLAGWICSNCSGISWSSQDVHGSPSSGSLKIDASTAATAGYPLYETASTGVTAGVMYNLSAYINDNTTTAWQSTVIARWQDVEGYDLGLAWQYSPNVKGAWNRGSATTAPAPMGATRIRITLIVQTVQATPATTSYSLFDDIAVVAYCAPPTASFSASPTSIPSGQSATLTWTSANATSVSIDHGVGNEPVSGSASVEPAATTTYTLTASGAGGTITKQTTVTVTDPPTITFGASPPSITAGHSSSLTWTTMNATSVSIDNGIGAQALSGSVIVNPSATTTYTLTASGAGGTRTATATVTVSTPGIPQVTFGASPSLIAAGGISTLTWTTTNANFVSIDNGIGVKPLSGSVEVHPTDTTTYKLTATGSGGSKTATTTVAIAAAPTIVFTATPPSVLPGGSVTLAWQVLDATFVTIDPDLGAEPVAGSVTVTPKMTTTYLLTATGVGGTRASSVTVVIGGKRRAAKH